jgi:hypothetical protein
MFLQNLVSISTPFGSFVKNTTLLQGQKIRKRTGRGALKSDYVRKYNKTIWYKVS